MSKVRMTDRNIEIIARKNAGETMSEIAKTYGITKQRVEQIAHGMHVPKHKRDEQTIEIAKEHILEARRNGDTYLEIQQSFGLSYRSLNKLVELFKENDTESRGLFFGTIGEKFGDWEIVDNKRTGKNRRSVLCRCACGKIKEVEMRYLREGKSSRCQSCAAVMWRIEKAEGQGEQ